MPRFKRDKVFLLKVLIWLVSLLLGYLGILKSADVPLWLFN